MKQALPPLSARSLWANPRAAFPVHLTGAFRCGFHMDAIAVSQELTPIRNDRNAVRPQVDENRLHTMSDKAPGLGVYQEALRFIQASRNSATFRLAVPKPSAGPTDPSRG